VSDGRYAMGTVLEISLVARSEPEGRALLDALYAETAALEAVLSSYDPESALSKLNAGAGGGFARVPPDLARILRESQELGARTQGAFDVTVGPLVALWREAARSGRLPGQPELAAARARVGARLLEVRGDEVRLAAAGAAVELGGIGKGFALDRLAETLARAGIADALLSFGESSMVALGAPPGAERWRLLVRGPGGGYAGVIGLRDQTLSVSSSFGGSDEIGGRRAGHILDPRSGRPVTQERVAVVVAPTATAGEAWSTALVVLGPQAGLGLAEAAPGVDALLLAPGEPPRQTPAFLRAAHFEALPAPP
jgi:thiamine biosynthesis lipoprotein